MRISLVESLYYPYPARGTLFSDSPNVVCFHHNPISDAMINGADSVDQIRAGRLIVHRGDDQNLSASQSVYNKAVKLFKASTPENRTKRAESLGDATLNLGTAKSTAAASNGVLYPVDQDNAFHQG